MTRHRGSFAGVMSGADKLALLNCRRLPARLDVTQTAALLNFPEHDIRFLSNSGLLEPLGKPAPNAPKYFASREIAALAENRDWLEKACRAVSNHWRMKNGHAAKAVSAG